MKKLAIGLMGLLAYTSLTSVYAAAGDRGDHLNARSDRMGVHAHQLL